MAAPSSRTSCRNLTRIRKHEGRRTFFFAATFMVSPCSNAKSPHSILQWQHHRDLSPRAPRATTIPARECTHDATSPRQPQTQQHLPRQLRNHHNNHHNLA
ncbi:hypothetical protein DEO72_LG6g1846 [Vigna unguiculata]|uniref:Uncharacterized protein n=1 Tax=Vigna unguiculata TaxID=3917 RepID=A0A4D6MAP3_VIGUN|nr:hypothetical protein DEO72_LG6g1846 [Vigna unguiculata]